MNLIVRMFVLIYLASSSFALAQGDTLTKHGLGVRYTFGANSYGPLLGLRKGGTVYTSSGYQHCAVSYNYKVKKTLYFESEIGLANHKITRHPADTPNNQEQESTENVLLITVPIGLKYLTGRHFFLNGGVLVDYDVAVGEHIDNQTGLGIYGGFGFFHDLNDHVHLFINPNFRIHSLVPAVANEYQDHLKEFAFAFGFRYQF